MPGVELLPKAPSVETIRPDGTLQGIARVSAVEVLQGAGAIFNFSGGPGAVTWVQATPAATWIIPHSLGRLPHVTLYDAGGTQIESDVTATTAVVNVVFPNALTGSAILT